MCLDYVARWDSAAISSSLGICVFMNGVPRPQMAPIEYFSKRFKWVARKSGGRRLQRKRNRSLWWAAWTLTTKLTSSYISFAGRSAADESGCGSKLNGGDWGWMKKSPTSWIFTVSLVGYAGGGLKHVKAFALIIRFNVLGWLQFLGDCKWVGDSWSMFHMSLFSVIRTVPPDVKHLFYTNILLWKQYREIDRKYIIIIGKILHKFQLVFVKQYFFLVKGVLHYILMNKRSQQNDKL